MNVGEQIVSSYLRYIRGCDFVQTNLYTIESAGEIDVVGINLGQKTVYVCEVAVHLTTGLLYAQGSKSNNVNKLVEKFGRDIQYAQKYLTGYTHRFELWSPIIKDSKGMIEHNQIDHMRQVHQKLLTQHGVDLNFVVNERFAECLEEMRAFSGRATEELKCPIMRMLQVEAYLGRHLKKLAPGRTDSIKTLDATSA